MKRAALLLFCVIASLAQVADVQRPKLLNAHGIWSARDEMFLQVKIVPHPDILAVVLEAWELASDEDDDPLNGNGILSEFVLPKATRRIGDLPIRRSEDEITRLERKQSVFAFKWRGLDYGVFELASAIKVRGGQTKYGQASTILVR